MAILDGRDPERIEHAAALLAAGELVAFPTETVYGLGARADDDAAVARIFEAKGRPRDHPLIGHVADAEQAAFFAPAPGAAAARLMQALWPGPVTVIVPRHPSRGAAAAGGQASIGLRMPSHPVAIALLQAAARRGVPGVAGPSANRFGRVSPTRAEHVLQEFGPALPVLDGGPCPVGVESAIVDCTRPGRPTLLRPGQIGRRRLEQVLGQPLAKPDAQAPRASGTLKSHYAPAATLSLLDRDELRRRTAGPPGAEGQGVAVYSRAVPPSGWLHRPMPLDADATARELFATLRDFDVAGAKAIWVEQPPPDATWDAVRDRLRRASTR
ncbi:MAG: L-threonylcarbamoyladenylate synthase [Pseudomonadota bacterium]